MLSNRIQSGPIARRAGEQGDSDHRSRFGLSFGQMELQRKNQALARENSVLKFKLQQKQKEIVPSRACQLSIDMLASDLKSLYDEFSNDLKRDLHRFIESRIDQAAANFTQKLTLLPNPTLANALDTVESTEHRTRLTPEERALHRQSSLERIKTKHKEQEDLSVIAELSRSRISESVLNSTSQQYQYSDAITALHQTTITRTISVSSEQPEEPVLTSTPEKPNPPPVEEAKKMPPARKAKVKSQTLVSEPTVSEPTVKKGGRKPPKRAVGKVDPPPNAGEIVSTHSSKLVHETIEPTAKTEDEVTPAPKATAGKGKGKQSKATKSSKGKKATTTPSPTEAISDLEDQLSKASIETPAPVEPEQGQYKRSLRQRKQVSYI